MSQYDEICELQSSSNTRQLSLSAHRLDSIQILQQVADSHTQQLLLDGNLLSQLDVFPSILCNLQHLDLSRNNIYTLHNSPFQNLTELRVLILSHNSIHTVEGFQGLHSLQHLDLSHNSISKLSGLSDLRQLRDLNLSYNELEEIEDLSPSHALENLDVSSNFICTLHGVSDLLPQSIRSFDISSNSLNNIQSLTFLSGLNSLQSINCEGNPFIVTAVRNNYSYRSFICFVLPAIKNVDGFLPSAIEQQEGQQMFCEENCHDLSSKLLQLLDAGHELSLQEYLQTACPIELKSESKFRQLQGNLDERSSSELITVNKNHSEGFTNFDEIRLQFLSRIRFLNDSLSVPDIGVSASSRVNLKTVAATVIQSHWRRKRIQSAYNSYMRFMRKPCGQGECHEPAHKALEGRFYDMEISLVHALQELATLKGRLRKGRTIKDTNLLE